MINLFTVRIWLKRQIKMKALLTNELTCTIIFDCKKRGAVKMAERRL